MSFQKEPENSFYSAERGSCVSSSFENILLFIAGRLCGKNIQTLMAYRERDDLVEQHYGGHVKVEHEILKNISLII